MVKRYDVAVVGAGTAGAVAARQAAAAGAHTVLIDAHPAADQPSVCAGLISPRTLDALGVGGEIVLRPIRGVRIQGPDGTQLRLRHPEARALVIDRRRTRGALLNAAAEAGVELLAPARCVSAAPGSLRIRLGDREETVETCVIVGADGVPSTVARSFGLGAPQWLLPARQIHLSGRLEAEDEVEVHIGCAVAPGFFAWAVPAEPGELRVGIACGPSEDPEPRLEALRERSYPGRPRARGAATIPLGAALPSIADGALLVGDAAGQVKPISGGGIYTGARCAAIAGRIAAWAALSGRTTAEDLRPYEQQWQAEIGNEIAFGMEIHRLRAGVSDRQLAAALQAASDPRVLALLAEEGDIDAPSRLVDAFLGRPELWPTLMPLIGLLGGAAPVVDAVRRIARLIRPPHL
jgi:geranylgeranyl reductase family protein